MTFTYTCIVTTPHTIVTATTVLKGDQALFNKG